MTRDELIAALESAEEGSREINAKIAVHIWFPDYRFPKQILNRKPEDWQEAWGRLTHDGTGGEAPLPAYSTSLDAKLPEENIENVSKVSVVETSPIWSAWHVERKPNGMINAFEGRAKTEALARRLAALKEMPDEA